MVHSRLRALLETLAALFGFGRRFARVRGDSMFPTFHEGDLLIYRPSRFQRHPPLQGDVVLARHPFLPGKVIVKRVQSVDPTGEVFLVGDNALASSDSRSFGPLAFKYLIGTITLHLPRTPR